MAVKNRKKQFWLGIFLMLALLTCARNNSRAEEVQTDRISTDQMSEDIAEIIDRGKLRVAIIEKL